MSRHISVSLLRNCHRKLHAFNPLLPYNFMLSSSLPNLHGVRYLYSSLNSPTTETMPVTKLMQPLIHHQTDDVLSTVNKKSLSGDKAVKLLKVLRMQVLFYGVQSNQFKNDPKFKTLCDIFEKNCKHMAPNSLVSGLRSLLEVGVPPESTCIVAAEETIIENIYKFNALNLIGCLYYHRKFTETDLQKKVVTVLIKEIQNKVYEISSASELLMLIHVYHLFKDQHKKNIEQKIVGAIPLLKFQEICRVICTMAENSDRNIFILNILAFYLRQKPEKPNLKETIDVFYAFKKLNFIDLKLFNHLLTHFESIIPHVQQPSLISGLLTICGHLKWKQTGILDACGEWIKSHMDVCRIREFVAYILTLGALNHFSPKTKCTLDLLLPHLTLEKIKSSNVLLDVVWSLAILDHVPKELLLKVLSSEFYNPLIDESGSQASNNIKLKLLNLKGILKMKYPEHIFGCNLFLEPFKLPENLLIENCRKHVIKVLSNFVPKNKCLHENQVSSTGTFIDAVFIMDQNLKPLSLEEYGTMTNISSSTKPLPKDSKRIAFLIMFHKDYTMCDHNLTGVNALGIRLLCREGYTVVQISYNDFSCCKTEVEKAKYLLQKIKEAVKK